jgi:quinol monooxygenase YgiN
MSVMMMVRFDADADSIERAARDNHDTLMAIGARAKEQGCVHHRFYADNGNVVVIDEWESPEAFQRFYDGDPDIPTIMGAAGVTSAPDVRVLQPLAVDDDF